MVVLEVEGGEIGGMVIQDGTRGECGDSGGCEDLGEGNFVISYFYYKEPRHIKKFCPKLIGKNAQPQSSFFVHVMTNNQVSKTGNNYNISMSKSKYAKYL